MIVEAAIAAVIVRLRMLGLSAEQVDVVRCEDNVTALAYVYTDRPSDDFTVSLNCRSAAEFEYARQCIVQAVF